MEDTQLGNSVDSIAGRGQSMVGRDVVNKFMSYISQLEEENKLHNTVNKFTAMWEYLLSLEKNNQDLNNRMGKMEQKISALENSLESRKLYSPSFVNRKDMLLRAVNEKKVLDVNEVKTLIGITSNNYARQIMRQVSKEADVAFMAGDSRVPSKLTSKHYTFQEIKDYLIGKMPVGSSTLVSRVSEQFFIPDEKIQEFTRFLHPQFKYLRWRDGARMERVR